LEGEVKMAGLELDPSVFKLDDNMDKECIKLCKAMNKMPGIRTFESCCGHGRSPYHIWFLADSFESLPNLVYWFMGCHCGFYGWNVQVTTDCAASPVHFMVEGPIGAYEEADKIAGLIEEFVRTGEL
jgi:hypothetical protein